MRDVISGRACTLLLVFLFTMGALSAFAQHTAKGNGHDDAVTGSSGQQVAKDQSGKFRAPTPEELQVLTAGLAMNDSTEGLIQKTTETGAIVVDLQGRFENYSLAKMGPDGKIELGCAATAKEARQFFTTAPKKATNKPAVKPATDPSTWEVK